VYLTPCFCCSPKLEFALVEGFCVRWFLIEAKRSQSSKSKESCVTFMPLMMLERKIMPLTSPATLVVRARCRISGLLPTPSRESERLRVCVIVHTATCASDTFVSLSRSCLIVTPCISHGGKPCAGMKV
jgi:hypothetical protein